MSRVERIAARRRIGLMVAASAFLAWQVPMMDIADRMAAESEGIKSLVSLGGFAIWIIALLMLVGPWRPFTNREDQEALNDELTRANRGKAFFAGYLAMMAVAVLYFVLSILQNVQGVEAAHMIMVAGVVVPMYAFAVLERG